MYKKDLLRDYVKNSIIKEFSKNIKIRISNNLEKNYELGKYTEFLNQVQKSYDLINTLDIKYPSNQKPVLYIYIVPDENYGELLQIPDIFNKGTGGGRPVNCYDLDGFNSAFGISQNLCQKRTNLEKIDVIENTIHELSHIVHNQFFNKNQLIHEGLAEAIPLYVLDLEDSFEEHKRVLETLKEDQIYIAKELIEQSNNKAYGKEELLPNKSCSYRLSYISSYLFIRGILEIIGEKYNLSKKEATQHFLEMIKTSHYNNEWLICDIADILDIPQDELLFGKELQLETIKRIKNVSNKR